MVRIWRPLARAVAAAKPLVPDRAWPVLDTLASLGGSGALVGLPPFRRVVALAAHPDDEAVGCAGTLALLADAGAAVSVVYASDGEATRGSTLSKLETGRRRAAEGAAACRLLGLPLPRRLGLPDGGLPAMVATLAVCLTNVVEEESPEALFLPWFLDGHLDHQALSHGLARARIERPLEVWGYETWTPLPANRIVDVSAAMDRKGQALAAHATAHLAFDVSASLGINRWRSIHGLHGRGYAEGFLAAPVQDYLALMDKVTSR